MKDKFSNVYIATKEFSFSFSFYLFSVFFALLQDLRQLSINQSISYMVFGDYMHRLLKKTLDRVTSRKTTTIEKHLSIYLVQQRWLKHQVSVLILHQLRVSLFLFFFFFFLVILTPNKMFLAQYITRAHFMLAI